ncbi:hypothetical protein PCAR4_1010006 [Paraburkholderia caribensis]|nr:hypothetical protein PCAR4_1010006 [Paraburkholderia caribensis]
MRQPLQYTLRLLQCGSLAVRHRVALCALSAKAVHHHGVRLVQVRAALQRSVRRDSSDFWARRRCIAAAPLCTDVRLLTLIDQLSWIRGETEHERTGCASGLEGRRTRAAKIAVVFEAAIHALKESPPRMRKRRTGRATCPPFCVGLRRVQRRQNAT